MRTPTFAALTVFVFIAVAIMARLGIWQLDRLEEKREQNKQRTALHALPPLELPSATIPSPILERPAVANGRFLSEPAFRIINRSRKGAPGVEIVSTMELTDGSLLLVDRGFVPLESKFVAPAPPSGTTRVTGYLFESISHEREAHPSTLPPEEWVRLAPREMAKFTGKLLLPYALVATATVGVGRFPIAKQFPPIDEGPHMSYAIQWFSFATIFLVGWGAIAWRRRQHHSS